MAHFAARPRTVKLLPNSRRKRHPFHRETANWKLCQIQPSSRYELTCQPRREGFIHPPPPIGMGGHMDVRTNRIYIRNLSLTNLVPLFLFTNVVFQLSPLHKQTKTLIITVIQPKSNLRSKTNTTNEVPAFPTTLTTTQYPPTYSRTLPPRFLTHC